MINAVRYDEERRLLEVHFNSGRVYCYEDVPPEVFEELLEADSKGQYMRANIIDVYPYSRGPCRRRR
ncbi:MAG: KTSC domain-containing protein [Thermoflexales bacterium]|nr:KTSC domain-containing protein [Thermoflexales bacterium]